MKQKYFSATGETAFRLWMFSQAAEELKKQPNKEKLANLLSKVKTFAIGNWVKFNATAEEKADLDRLVEELTMLSLG